MNAATPTMIALARRYLVHRRKLGYLLRIEGPQLLHFARFADRVAAHQPLTTALALQWATLPQTAQHHLYHAKRLELLRGFARYCAVFDPRTQVPPTRLIGPAHCRRPPHIYSAQEIRTILRRAAALPVVFRADPLRPLTYTTLFGLIACTGMRLGEALRLTSRDVDPAAGTLRIPRAKASPERIVPLHSSVVRALRRYLAARAAHPVFGERLFVGRNGTCLSARTVHGVFWHLTPDMVGRGSRARVRIHDFRHTFATRLIAQWSRQRAPVAHHLLLLGRYLGHQTFAQTFWYVSADPRALQTVAGRFDRYCHAKTDNDHDFDLFPNPHPKVLCRAPHGPARCQPSNRGGVSRHLPTAAPVSFRLPPPSRR